MTTQGRDRNALESFFQWHGKQNCDRSSALWSSVPAVNRDNCVRIIFSGNLFNQPGGSDEVHYDKGNNTYFLAMSSWTSTGKTGTGNPTPSLGIIDAGNSDNGNKAPQFIQNILTTRTSHSVAAGFGFRCSFDDRGRSHCENDDGNKGNDILRKHAYVPLTTIPIPLSSTATLNEPGGIGIYGQLP